MPGVIKRKPIHGLLLLGCLGLTLFCLIYPLYVIRPFRHQGARELAAALLVMRYRPVLTTLAAVTALVSVVLHWRAQRRIFQRIIAALGAVLVCFCVILSRVNVYELMFHPLGPPSFVSADETKLDGDEMVIAVVAGWAARAYPIRNISYHHIVNDVLGGVPIVATY